jgi:hypothetical protein
MRPSTQTRSAAGSVTATESAIVVLIILPFQQCLVFENQPLDLPQIVPGHSAISGKTNRFKPKLALAV